jgi:hypothetical protein
VSGGAKRRQRKRSASRGGKKGSSAGHPNNEYPLLSRLANALKRSQDREQNNVDDNFPQIKSETNYTMYVIDANYDKSSNKLHVRELEKKTGNELYKWYNSAKPGNATKAIYDFLKDNGRLKEENCSEEAVYEGLMDSAQAKNNAIIRCTASGLYAPSVVRKCYATTSHVMTKRRGKGKSMKTVRGPGKQARRRTVNVEHLVNLKKKGSGSRRRSTSGSAKKKKKSTSQKKKPASKASSSSGSRASKSTQSKSTSASRSSSGSSSSSSSGEGSIATRRSRRSARAPQRLTAGGAAAASGGKKRRGKKGGMKKGKKQTRGRSASRGRSRRN